MLKGLDLKWSNTESGVINKLYKISRTGCKPFTYKINERLENRSWEPIFYKNVNNSTPTFIITPKNIPKNNTKVQFIINYDQIMSVTSLQNLLFIFINIPNISKPHYSILSVCTCIQQLGGASDRCDSGRHIYHAKIKM